MSDTKISELPAMAYASIASGDWLPVVNSDLNSTRKLDISNMGKIYPTVAAFIADTDYTPINGTIVWIGLLTVSQPVGFVADSSANVTGLRAGWVPFGGVTPDHWADNTTPGTTDMAPALRNALDYGQVVNLLPYVYRLNSAVSTAVENSGIKGSGDKSRLRRGFASGNLLSFANPDGLLLGVTLKDFSIESAISSVTGGASILLDGVRNTNLNSINIYDGLIGFHFKGVSQTNVDNCMVLYEQDNGGLTTGRKYVLIEETENANIASVWCGDLFFTNFNGRCGGTPFCENGIQIHSGDGVWFSNSHIGNCTSNNLRIISDRTIKNTGLLFSNVWFDIGSGQSVSIEGGTPTLNGVFRFNGCKFLGGGTGSRGFNINNDAERVSIRNSEISGYLNEAISLGSSFTGDVEVSDASIEDVSRGGDGTANAISLIGAGALSVKDCSIKNAGSFQYARAIQITGATTTRANLSVQNVDMEDGTLGTMQVVSTGLNNTQTGNKGFNPVGTQTVLTVGASPWTYTNEFAFPIEVYIGGGIISQFEKNGNALPPGGREVIVLGSGDNMTLTYSSAPTVHAYGQ